MSSAADRSFAEKAKIKAAAKMEERRKKLKAADALAVRNPAAASLFARRCRPHPLCSLDVSSTISRRTYANPLRPLRLLPFPQPRPPSLLMIMYPKRDMRREKARSKEERAEDLEKQSVEEKKRAEEEAKVSDPLFHQSVGVAQTIAMVRVLLYPSTLAPHSHRRA